MVSRVKDRWLRDIDRKEAEKRIEKYDPRFSRLIEITKEITEDAKESVSECSARKTMKNLINLARLRDDTDYKLAELANKRAPKEILVAFEYESEALLDDIDDLIDEFVSRCDCIDPYADHRSPTRRR